ncbi:hypothetical protein GGS23DRAFT_229901 [Durotheca rogersii]|uniref:uncharacterized protein n=1 Tax=Durotheca rogersii TaxID=419775 RepID=UPI00221F96A2|nr:uncharacterized protein GGS23DRAFT_229901 [Durotheca rogersii]KAI5860581.1 hypothetical protein GGS23DRAFT_229901 [Durotheca rogersii]
MYLLLVVILALRSAVTATPIASQASSRRLVKELNQAAFEEAHQRDNTATRAFTNTQIRTSDGRCLFVDELSGDFRANLTPIQVAECGATDGQGWDVITAGKHNNAQGSALIVSSLTNACFNFDPRRPSGNQALLFSCGGRADGSGEVTDSQLFSFDSSSGPVTFSPRNEPQLCFTVKGDIVDAAPCAAGNADQQFTFGEASGNAPVESSVATNLPIATSDAPAPTQPGNTATVTVTVTVTTGQAPVTVTVTAGQPPVEEATSSTAGITAAPSPTNGAGGGGIPNPTEAVPVSRAGGVLQPSAAAEAHQRDETATRAFTAVSIQAPNGQCLFIDPTAGDFRQNLIPVSLVECAGTPNEKFDIITSGVHNNAQNAALLVSSLTNGCISFDGRRQAGDTVTLFSCGGRAAGEGETNSGQLVPFIGGTDLVIAPVAERNATCIVPGDGRLDSAPCANDGSQVFTILA